MFQYFKYNILLIERNKIVHNILLELLQNFVCRLVELFLINSPFLQNFYIPFYYILYCYTLLIELYILLLKV